MTVVVAQPAGSGEKFSQHSPWHKLTDLDWHSTPKDIHKGLPPDLLSPLWQMLVLGNGSPTRLLQLLTGGTIAVAVIDTEVIGDSLDNGPSELKLIGTPRVRRQIWLKSAQTNAIFAYAVSWWHKQDLESFLPDPNLPIGTNLNNQRLEVYRDLRAVYRGKCPTLDPVFGENSLPQTYWGRYYLMWHQGKPLNLIYEIFHPRLQDYLGATSG